MSPSAELMPLLRSLQPRLVDGRFAFCRWPDGEAVPISAIGCFRESEGLTVILPLSDAGGRIVDFETAWIALGVESPLAAVGLTAAVSAVLAAEGISCNVVAACRHDHLFVPPDRAADAMRILADLQRRSTCQ
jgi:hypothetical protein